MNQTEDLRTADAAFVQDFAGRFHPPGVYCGALMGRQSFQDIEGQRCTERQGFPRREQRIAAEKRKVPGGSSGDKSLAFVVND